MIDFILEFLCNLFTIVIIGAVGAIMGVGALLAMAFITNNIILGTIIVIVVVALIGTILDRV